MKLRWQDTDAYMKKLSKDVMAVLIYGPNRGQVNTRADAMTKAILGDAIGDPFRHFNIDSATLDESPQALAEEALTTSFGGEQKFIRLKNPPKKAAEFAAELLQNKDNNFFLLVTCEELAPKDAWRKLFEETENGGICACYIADSPREVISAKLRSGGVSIDPDAMQLLSEKLQGRDNGIINMEVEKLLLYATDTKKISAEDVRNLCGSGSETDIDSLIISCLAGKSLKQLDNGLDGLYKQGVNEIMIIRTLIRNLRKVAQLKAKLAEGADFKSAAGSMRIFYKLQPDFQQAARLWSDAALYTLILQAQATEANSKFGYGFEQLIVARTLQRITAMAGNLAKR